MCSNQAITFAATTIVQAFVATHKMFTAFDVTSAIREKVGKGTQIPHADVKEIVHGLYRRQMMGSDYDRQMVVVGAKGEQALVYHHFNDNPNDYKPNGQSQVSATAVTVNSQPVSQPALSAGTVAVASAIASVTSASRSAVRHLSGNRYQRDSRGRVRTPSSLMAQVGFNAGDTAFVVTDVTNQTINVCRTAPQLQPGQYVKPFTVDAYNNLLLKPQVLATDYKFTATRDSVVIQPA